MFRLIRCSLWIIPTRRGCLTKGPDLPTENPLSFILSYVNDWFLIRSSEANYQLVAGLVHATMCLGDCQAYTYTRYSCVKNLPSIFQENLSGFIRGQPQRSTHFRVEVCTYSLVVLSRLQLDPLCMHSLNWTKVGYSLNSIPRHGSVSVSHDSNVSSTQQSSATWSRDLHKRSGRSVTAFPNNCVTENYNAVNLFVTNIGVHLPGLYLK